MYDPNEYEQAFEAQYADDAEYYTALEYQEAQERAELISEYHELQDRVVNLCLYLDEVREVAPIIFAHLMEKFSGLPGYVSRRRDLQ